MRYGNEVWFSHSKQNDYNKNEMSDTDPIYSIRKETSVTTGAGTYSESLIKAKRQIKIVIYCFCDDINFDF
ncbi:MAG: hypothetical protein IKG87_13120 [Clostridia bacterium]|nr:hypothetical protein [Clostridia bacterium]